MSYPPYGWQQPQCRVCSCVPAARTAFHGHKTQYIWMYFLREEGPFCHDCGMATYRRMTANTLVQGWWGPISCIATPITVVVNLILRGKVAKLPAPVPAPDGGSGRPLDPGRPLYGRVRFWVGILLPSFLLFLLIFLSVLTTEWNQAVHHAQQMH